MLYQNAAIMLYLIAAAFLPVGWTLVMAGHSYGHYWFTYKEFAISGFALLSLGIYLKNLIYEELRKGKAVEKQDLQ